MEYQKTKSVSKKVQTRGPALEKTILQTMRTISDIVGSTLGPGGRQVLIERQEHGLPPMITKDGVTVFRALGFDDSAAHCIMEAARDAAIRTATEAGDGTTTATILSEAIVRLIKLYSDANPRVSPQRVVRRIEQVFHDIVEPLIRRLSRTADLSTPEGRSMLEKVATISANGDAALAKAVIECFDLVGDDGNVTIAEVNGASAYEVERIEGYPITEGYERSTGKFHPKFVNDIGNQRVLLDRPRFVIYHGRIQDEQSLFRLLQKLGYEFENGSIGPNVVLVATGFSDRVIQYLAMMFPESGALNVFPLMVPETPFPQGQLDFMLDLAAITGAELLDQIELPLEQAEAKHLGVAASFEAGRVRSNLVGEPNSDHVLLRVDQLQTQLARAESQLEMSYLQERIGKLTGGIARLKIMGVSNGETKEKKDRADDAVCAVRGAIRHGCLPGGGWTLLRVMSELMKDARTSTDPIIQQVLKMALFEPFRRLLENLGVTEENPDEMERILKPIVTAIEISDVEGVVVYDALEDRHVDPFEGGILDSTPAVLEAIRNSLSIASLLGTSGGIVAFNRDTVVERQEARDRANWQRDANVNEANERG